MGLSTITIPIFKALSKNPVRMETLSTSHGALVNYRVVIKVLFEKVYASGTYGQVAEVEAIPDAAGICRFDFQNILHAELQRNYTLRIPDLVDQHPYPTDSTRRFKLEYLEKYGEPQVEQAGTTIVPVKLLYGGVDQHYFGLNDFFDNITDTNSLLSYYPESRHVNRTEPGFITFLNHRTSDNYFGLKIESWDIDNTPLPTIERHKGLAGGDDDPPSLAQWQSAVYPVTPAVIGLDSSAVKYTVQVFETDTGTATLQTAASQIVTYYINDLYQDLPTEIIWLGGFDSPQVLRCTGNKQTSLNISRAISAHIFTNNADPRQLSRRQFSRDWNNVYRYRTGAVSSDEKIVLQEMLIENNLFEYGADGNYYRLNLTDKRYDVFTQRSSPNALEFSAERALPPGNYMNLLPVTAVPGTTSKWQINDNGYWLLNTGSGYWQTN